MAIAFLIGASALVPGSMLNDPNDLDPARNAQNPLEPSPILIDEPPPPPPDETGDNRSVRCDVPGTIQNDSSHVILITGDIINEDGDEEWIRRNLQPKENSTKYMCDTDYMASEHVTWQWADDYTVAANWWSAYLFNLRIRCHDHVVNGIDSFRCYAIGVNYNP